MRGTSPELEGRAERKKAHGIESWNLKPVSFFCSVRGRDELRERPKAHFRTFEAFEGFHGFSCQAGLARRAGALAGARGGHRRPWGAGSAGHSRAFSRMVQHRSASFSTSSARQFCGQKVPPARSGKPPPQREPSPRERAPRKRGARRFHF